MLNAFVSATKRLLFTAAAAATVLPAVHCQVLANPLAARHKVLLQSYLATQARAKSGFNWTWEDILPSGGGKYAGIGGLRVVPPPAGSTIRQAMRFLRPQVPSVKIWRAAGNRRVAHFADRRILAWGRYPLAKKLTFHGTMSIAQLESRMLRRLVPGVHFYNLLLLHRSVPIPFPSNGEAIMTPMRFNVKGLTLRHLLTTGWRYHMIHRGMLWSADVYQRPNGRFTGRVDVTIIAVPEIPAPAPRPTRQGAK